jgi:FixJ family two-component response regulator
MARKKLEDISIDQLMGKGLMAIYGIMKSINNEVRSEKYKRNTVMNLKDVMAILKELKKEEREILSKMTDEEISKKLNDH